MLYIFPCSVSLPSQSVQLLLIFFCFQSSIQIFIRTSLCHRNCLLCLTLFFLCTSFYYFHLLFYPMLSSPPSFILCSSELPHFTTMSFYLRFVFQMSLPAQFQLFFLAFPPFSSTHQVTDSRLQNSCSLPFQLTIAHFLQVSPSAHHIVYLGTFIRHPVFVFLLEISVNNRQIYPLRKIPNHASLLLVLAPHLPIISSSPMFPSPTYPFRSEVRAKTRVCDRSKRSIDS